MFSSDTESEIRAKQVKKFSLKETFRGLFCFLGL
uniref:Uncharacterized protein n=1 Tax=Rhodocyclus tenuis TaxID=1066 RepID=A0A840GAJ7_RHOTE|nr:hypothetical protein [Rhodocyclus tenuis]